MPLSIQGRPDESTALAVIAAFVDGGGDSHRHGDQLLPRRADFGHNERLIAKALRTLAAHGHRRRNERRAHASRTDAGKWTAARSGCAAAASRALRDLGAPIALYYLHTVDPAVPLADSVGELVRLRDEGKIVAIGLSNVNARQLDEALRLTPIAAVQNRCNVLDRRDFDSGLVDRCRELGIAYVPYSSVGGHGGHRRLAQQPTLARIAAKHSTSIYVIALAWLLAQGRAHPADSRRDQGREHQEQPVGARTCCSTPRISRHSKGSARRDARTEARPLVLDQLVMVRRTK